MKGFPNALKRDQDYAVDDVLGQNKIIVIRPIHSDRAVRGDGRGSNAKLG
jgi:hypothetical protein